MSKDYFTKVDLDAVFPAEVEQKINAATPKGSNEKTEEIAAAVANISAELERVRTGASKLVPHAVQFVESKTPFCINLAGFQANPSLSAAFYLVALARQDFSERFSKFVLEQFQTIYGSK